MSFLKYLKNTSAQRATSEPVEDEGLPSSGSEHAAEPIGTEFTSTYEQANHFGDGSPTIVEDEKRVITDRLHSEKAIRKEFLKNVTFKDYLKAVLWRLRQ